MDQNAPPDVTATAPDERNDQDSDGPWTQTSPLVETAYGVQPEEDKVTAIKLEKIAGEVGGEIQFPYKLYADVVSKNQQTTAPDVVNEHACRLLYAPTMVAGDAAAGGCTTDCPQHTTVSVLVTPHAKSGPAAIATAPNRMDGGGSALL